jgi:hypothetical protein
MAIGFVDNFKGDKDVGKMMDIIIGFAGNSLKKFDPSR